MEQTKRQFRKFEDSLKERLINPEYAKVFLDVALEEYEEDGNIEAFLLALRDVAEAKGEITGQIDLINQKLNKILSEEDSPNLKTLEAVLHELGFRLSVEPVRVRD